MAPLIVLLTYGSRGDVQPFFTLSRALLQAGYRVRLAAPQMSSAGVVQEGDAGFEFWPLEGDIDRLAEALAAAGSSLPGTMRVLSEFILPLAGRVFGELWRACQGADCIVHTFLLTDGAHTLAQELGIAEISVQFFPVHAPTAAFPAISFPDLPLGAAYRRWTHHANSAAFRFGGRMLYRRLRRSNPDLPRLAGWPFDPPPRPGQGSPGAGNPIPLAFAFSQQIMPYPPDWPAYVHLTGYWSEPAPLDYQPPERLLRFLEGGEPPVFIGFGSMLPRHDRGIVALCLQALRLSGLRALLYLPGLEEQLELPPSVLPLEATPYAWLFPRLSAALHHGGAGTTAASLQAGLPTLIAPFMGDQFFWAKRLADLGVGLRLPPIRRMQPAQLAQALETAARDAGLRQRAQALGQRLSREDGTARMLELIAKTLASKR
jgi:sterol 3beta-glucosyltransferase